VIQTVTTGIAAGVGNSARGARSARREHASAQDNRRFVRTRRARRHVHLLVRVRESCVVGPAAPAALRVRCAAAMGRPAQRLALLLESCVVLLVALRARFVAVMGKRVAVRMVRGCVARRGCVPLWGQRRIVTVVGMPVLVGRRASTAPAPAQ
jgi:hypothetical protein